MSDAILEELKSLQSDLTQQPFKAPPTPPPLAKIESVISKIDKIYNLKLRGEKLEEEVGGMKQLVNTTLTATKNLFQECNVKLKRRVERLERYSRD